MDEKLLREKAVIEVLDDDVSMPNVPAAAEKLVSAVREYVANGLKPAAKPAPPAADAGK